MPLAPAWEWIDVIVAFDDFLEAVERRRRIALADGIVKKLLTPITWPIPADFRRIADACPDGKSLLIAMIAEPSLETFKRLLAGRGAITYEAPTDEGAGEMPLYEYSWNHTTLQVLKRDRSVTYLQCLFPHDRLLAARRGDGRDFRRRGAAASRIHPLRRPCHRERAAGRALHDAGAAERDHRGCTRRRGVMVANPHVVHVWRTAAATSASTPTSSASRREVDPYGLLNPGKMRSFVGAEWKPA